MQSYYWWIKYVPPQLRRVFVKGAPGEIDKLDPAERRQRELAAGAKASSQRSAIVIRARRVSVLWSILAIVLLVSVFVGFLVWIDYRETNYEKWGRLLHPHRDPIRNVSVLYTYLLSLVVLFLPTLIAMITTLAHSYAGAFRAAMVAVVLALVMLFVDFLMLLSDTKGFSGLGTWASVFTTVHIGFLILTALLARASRNVKIWSDAESDDDGLRKMVPRKK